MSGILMLLVFSFVVLISVNFGRTAAGQNELTVEELENLKLQKEIQLLEEQINSSRDYFGEIFKQGLALIGIAGGAAATAFFAWRHERKIPPPAATEQQAKHK